MTDEAKIDRPLTAGEIAMLRGIYGDSIEYGDVVIHNYPRFGFLQGGSVVTPNGQIYYPRGSSYYSSDISLMNLDARETLVHEADHVWQHQQGIDVVGVRLSQGGDYDYRDKISAGTPFSEWKIEEQAQYFEGLYVASRMIAR